MEAAPKEEIVCVEWDDASYNSGFYNKDRPKDFEPVFTRTVGHLVKMTKKTVIVSQDRFYGEDNKPESDKHISSIPKKMVRRIIYLEDRK